MKKVLIVHGGGPTAVLNSSLYGAIMMAKEMGVSNIIGARNGCLGLANNDFIDLSGIDNKKLSLLKQTPGTSLGSSRYPLEANDYEDLVKILNKIR